MLNDEVAAAIRHGDLGSLELFLRANPEAANARMDGQRTLLHVSTDWPGHFSNVRETIELLVRHGADLNAAFEGGRHAETPLHWAASSDDVVALDTLLDLGARIEAPGSVIDGGAPLSDAVAFAQWKAAHRLVARGARSTIWQSAALGLMDRLQQHFAGEGKPSSEEVTNAFWNACRSGQLEAAKYLSAQGAALNRVGHGGLTPLAAAAKSGNTDLVEWLHQQGADLS
jgi:ankyrin repeat protein